MRRWAVIALVLVGFSVGALAIPLCEYRSPQTDLSDLIISFSYQYHNNPYGLEDYDVSRGKFAVEFVRLYDEPTFGFDVSLHNEMLISVFDVSTYSAVADGSYKRYFSSEKAHFAFAGVSARSSSSYEALGLTINLGIGYGRFVDVTPLAKATRIDTFLVKRGSLHESLHPVDLQILADEIESLTSYESLADLLTTVQEIIEDSGRVARVGGLDALDISEITQLIQDDSYSRYCGGDIKVGLGYELLDPSGEENDLLITGAFNYAFATSPNVQFLVQGSFSGAPAILETNRVDVTASYDYLITGFCVLKLTYVFSRETWVGVPTDIHKLTFDLAIEPLETAAVVLGVEFEHRPYYLEWSVDVRLSISMELL
jgi:hypothetical protein